MNELYAFFVTIIIVIVSSLVGEKPSYIDIVIIMGISILLFEQWDRE